jgi:Flp pilus assembly pilin Flp
MIKEVLETVQGELDQEHPGAVAFEYVIILVIMAVAIFTAWGVLADQVIIKANEIAEFIRTNGRSGVSEGTGHRGTQQWGN